MRYTLILLTFFLIHTSCNNTKINKQAKIKSSNNFTESIKSPAEVYKLEKRLIPTRVTTTMHAEGDEEDRQNESIFEYDSMNKLIGVVTNATTRKQISYENNGLVSSIELYNVDSKLNNLDQLTSDKHSFKIENADVIWTINGIKKHTRLDETGYLKGADYTTKNNSGTAIFRYDEHRNLLETVNQNTSNGGDTTSISLNTTYGTYNSPFAGIAIPRWVIFSEQLTDFSLYAIGTNFLTQNIEREKHTSTKNGKTIVTKDMTIITNYEVLEAQDNYPTKIKMSRQFYEGKDSLGSPLTEYYAIEYK